MKDMTDRMHLDDFAMFTKRSNDHHDLLRNGFLAMTHAAANLKTLLMSGRAAGGVRAGTPCP